MEYNEGSCEERTTMQISMSFEDKVALKTMAAVEGLTVAALIHQWIGERQADHAKVSDGRDA